MLIEHASTYQIPTAVGGWFLHVCVDEEAKEGRGDVMAAAFQQLVTEAKRTPGDWLTAHLSHLQPATLKRKS